MGLDNPAKGGPRKNSGRKPSGAARGRALCREMANDPEALKNVSEQIKVDAMLWLKVFEAGYGRAPQSLKLDTGKTEVVVNFGGSKPKELEGVSLDAELVDAVNATN